MLRNNFKLSQLTLFLIGTLIVLGKPALAQNSPQNSTSRTQPSSEKRSVMDLLRYDPKQQGPLLFVTQNRFALEYDVKNEQAARQLSGGKTPAQFAERMKRRVIKVGNITTLVPPTMKEIVKNLGKPDPYVGLRFDQRFVLLLGTLTREQWKQAGSTDGIGFNSLTTEQRSLFAGIWRSETVKIRTVRKPKDSVNPLKEDSDAIPISDMRFRLSRQVSLRLQPVNSEANYAYQPRANNDSYKGELQADGSYVRQELLSENDPLISDSQETVSVFGVPIVVTVPNRLKNGHLSLDAPAVNVGMRLDGSHKTVAELLSAVSEATHFRFVADKRLATLSIGYILATEGQEVSIGDVLKALCRSVTGTFRRLNGPNGETMYLLTDDVEGIGTRFARLDRWAAKPKLQRSQIYQKSLDDCAENDPLASLFFAPGYPYTLPDEQLKTINDSYRLEKKSALTLSVNQLSPVLQEEFKKGVESLHEFDPKINISTDNVNLETDFHCDWMLPGGRTIPAQFNGALDVGFLRQIAVPKSKRHGSHNTPPDGKSLSLNFPPALKRRILALRLPPTVSESKSLFTLLTQKGFNEAWFRIEKNDATTKNQLQMTIALGVKANVRVGVIIPWLLKEKDGVKTTLDVNILGETGDELVNLKSRNITDKHKASRQRVQDSDRYMGWVIPEAQDAQKIAQCVSPFMNLVNLSEVVFTNFIAPGYGGYEENGDPYSIGDHMGYNEQLRFRCVQEKGFDPIDITTSSSNLGISIELPFFRQYDMVKNLAEFREAEHKTYLAQIYTDIRSQFPQTTLYLDSRSDKNGLLGFYGRWEKPDGFAGLAKPYLSDAKKLRVIAFRNSPTPVFAIRGEPTNASFWNTWHDSIEEAANGWGGFSLNMSTDSLADVTTLLKKLPDDTTPVVQ